MDCVQTNGKGWGLLRFAIVIVTKKKTLVPGSRMASVPYTLGHKYGEIPIASSFKATLQHDDYA